MNTTLVPLLSNHSVVLVRTLRSIPSLKEQPVPFHQLAKAAVTDINGGQRLHALHHLLES